MPDYQKHIVYLSEAQKEELFLNGSITVNGRTITYSDSDLYLTPQAAPLTDVQVNGTSIVQNGVANVPVAGVGVFGVIKSNNMGVAVNNSGEAYVLKATSTDVKAGTANYKPIVPSNQQESAFYGLAKAAGDSTQSASSNAVGTYTDAAKASIQHMLGTDTNIAPYESDTTADAAYTIGEMFMLNGKLYQATAAIAIGDTLEVGTNCAISNASEVFPHDVQVNGTSVVSNGVANVPAASTSDFGVVRIYASRGLMLNANKLQIDNASVTDIKAGANNSYKVIIVDRQDASTFYGLAKAAGDSTQSASSNAVGTYTVEAKAAIQSMLGIDLSSIASQVEIPLVETVSGTTPSITGQPNTRYNCGEVSTISITPPASGSIDVIFESGSTAAVLTVPNTVKWPSWFDATSLDTNTIYEILITDGVYGSVMSWAT